MYVSTNGNHTVKIEFNDDEIEDFEKIASLQGWSLRVFVSRAIGGYYRLIREVHGD